MYHILNIKGKGRLSAETIVTARITITHHLQGDDEPTIISAQMTAAASGMELFLIPYTHDVNAEVEVRILDIYTPLVREHDDNLRWLSNLQQLHQGEDHFEMIEGRETDAEPDTEESDEQDAPSRPR